MPHIKINQPTKDYIGTEIEVNGQKISGVRNIDYHVGVDGETGIKLDIIGTAGVDLEADYISFAITPDNIQSAVEILRYSLSKDNPRCKHLGIDNEPRKAFIASILSAIEEYETKTEQRILYKPSMAEKILDRIIGED